ncbi:hypothetical protein D3A96_12885 [Robertkochia marina]|nr:hypothetical protein D3A96_12885 [Robertkochia marina]
MRSMQRRVSSGSAKQKLPQIFLIFWFVLHQGKMNINECMKRFLIEAAYSHHTPQEFKFQEIRKERSRFAINQFD